MPKAQMIEPTTPRVYSMERLQELRHEADISGDSASRDALTEKIRQMGGNVPTGVIPENETKRERLMRLRQDALDVNDIETADRLAEMIAKEEPEVETTEHTVPPATGIVYDAGSEPPLDGGMNVNTSPTEPQDAPGSDIERIEGPKGIRPVNDGTASINAFALIEKMGYSLDDIPARFGGKLDLHDVKNYRKMLESE